MPAFDGMARAAPGDTRPPRWGMVVDLNRCIGCQTCTIACKQANDTPPGVQWRQVLDVEFGAYPDVARLFLVTGCQHCDNPSCVPVCPTGATYRRTDGIVAIDYDRCIGCGSCAVACPYQARHLVHERKRYFGDLDTAPERAVARAERDGVAQKCTFCVGKIDATLKHGMVPGKDLHATPVCAASCITQALRFGDFNDPGSDVARLVGENDSFVLNEALGTRPMIRYLYRTPAVPGGGRDLAALDDERMRDLENPLVGPLQRRWDLRAAINFTLGGAGAGLAVATWLAEAALDLPASVARFLFLLAAAIIAAGLLSVFFEIGRKRRFLHALRRPQTSWMSREIYAVGLLYLLVAANLWQPRPALAPLIAAAAAAFLYCQARILHAGKGIPAWRAKLIPWMLLASGLFEGLGALLAVLFAVGHAIAPTVASPLVLLLAMLNGWLWRDYRAGAEAGGIGPLARDRIDAATPWLHAVGHAAPALLALAALAAPAGAAAPLLALSGVATCAGGALWKIVIVTRAAYFQNLVLPKLPQRGSGTRSAFAAAGHAEGRSQ